MRHVSGGRRKRGIAPGLGLTDNDPLWHFRHGAFGRFGWLRRGRARGRVVGPMGDFDSRAPHPETPFEALSCGNQRKRVLARELTLGLRIPIAAHPTRGRDVGAVVLIQDRLMARRPIPAG